MQHAVSVGEAMRMKGVRRRFEEIALDSTELVQAPDGSSNSFI